MNAGKKYKIPFEREGLESMYLEDALNGSNANMKRFARQFTMLEQPEQLVELGKYFQKFTVLQIPDASCRDKTFALLGYGGLFDLSANLGLYYCGGASRGVSRCER